MLTAENRFDLAVERNFESAVAQLQTAFRQVRVGDLLAGIRRRHLGFAALEFKFALELLIEQFFLSAIGLFGKLRLDLRIFRQGGRTLGLNPILRIVEDEQRIPRFELLAYPEFILPNRTVDLGRNLRFPEREEHNHHRPHFGRRNDRTCEQQDQEHPFQEFRPPFPALQTAAISAIASSTVSVKTSAESMTSA